MTNLYSLTLSFLSLVFCRKTNFGGWKSIIGADGPKKNDKKKTKNKFDVISILSTMMVSAQPHQMVLVAFLLVEEEDVGARGVSEASTFSRQRPNKSFPEGSVRLPLLLRRTTDSK